jgi:hypothetical protein
MSETYCVYPFINVHTNTDGRCKLCCHVYSEDYIQVDGKDAVLGKTDWNNIWNSQYMLDVRANSGQTKTIKHPCCIAILLTWNLGLVITAI